MLKTLEPLPPRELVELALPVARLTTYKPEAYNVRQTAEHLPRPQLHEQGDALSALAIPTRLRPTIYTKDCAAPPPPEHREPALPAARLSGLRLAG